MSEVRVLKDTTANPAPLGLLGFAMTTILLNIHNAGFYELNTMIMSMGIFYGGIIQIIAGVLEWKKGNTFGMVAFSSYGAFWLSLVFLWNGSLMGMPANDHFSMGCYLAMLVHGSDISFLRKINRLVLNNQSIVLFRIGVCFPMYYEEI